MHINAVELYDYMLFVRGGKWLKYQSKSSMRGKSVVRDLRYFIDIHDKYSPFGIRECSNSHDELAICIQPYNISPDDNKLITALNKLQTKRLIHVEYVDNFTKAKVRLLGVADIIAAL